MSVLLSEEDYDEEEEEDEETEEQERLHRVRNSPFLLFMCHIIE